MRINNKVRGILSTIVLATSLFIAYDIGRSAGVEGERERVKVEEMRNHDWRSFSDLFYSYSLKRDVDDVIPFVDEQELEEFYYNIN